MATSEGIMQKFCGISPYCLGTRTYISNYDSSVFSKSYRTCVLNRGLRFAQAVQCSSVQKVRFRYGGFSGGLYEIATRCRSRSSIVCCESAESVKGSASVDGNGTWYADNAKNLNPINSLVNGSNTLEDVQQLRGEKEITVSGRNLVSAETEIAASDKITVDLVEEEAWELLRDSVVNYCGSPVGTIAANDPTSSDALNYDQVFIRDFIPSAMAFLLKGEYDIVRNFLLHTLQLQNASVFLALSNEYMPKLMPSLSALF